MLIDHMIKSVTIDSCLFGFGPIPKPDEEVCQKLTINRRGSVFFTGKNFDGKTLRRENAKIGKEKAEYILSLLHGYTTQGEYEWWICDSGSFVIWEKDECNRRIKSDGDTVGQVTYEDVNIGEYIMENIPIEGVNPFGNFPEVEKGY